MTSQKTILLLSQYLNVIMVSSNDESEEEDEPELATADIFLYSPKRTELSANTRCAQKVSRSFEFSRVTYNGIFLFCYV